MNAAWKRRINNRIQDTGGFTLVELIVVLIVLAILCTLAVMSIIAWQDYADFKQNNEYARSIFQAAQVQLTQYAERGQLTELSAAVTNGKEASRSEYMLSEQGNLMDSEGNPLNVAAEADGTIWENGYSGNIYFLMAEKGDYRVYTDTLAGLSFAESRALTARERRIKALYDMIDPYISDKAMLDAAICIEFDPDPKVALVYSVFYNHKAEKFTYESMESDTVIDGIASIQDRSSKARRKAKTGYYGVDTMARGTDTYISRPVISNVRLNNEETLNLSWSTKGDDGRELTKLIYNINLYGQKPDTTGDGKLLMSITVGKTDKEQIPVTEGRVSAIVSWPKEKDTWISEEYIFPVTVNTADNSIVLVLDGLDLDADENTHSEEMKKTASIRRLGLKADIIYAVITGSRSGVYDITIKKQSNSEHQYFGAMTPDEDGSVTYTIENARHLNNIRYREADIMAAGGIRAPKLIYQISRDISWETALNRGAVYRMAVQQFPVAGDITPYYFKPILKLQDHSVLESDNGEQGRSLTKFRFDAAHTASGSDKYLGLVADNRGTIRNLSMKGVYVNGATSVAVSETQNNVVYAEASGAFCGINNGILQNLLVEDSFDRVPSQIRGLAYVGGIAGRSGSALAGDDSQSYSKLVNRANVTGQRYVGGIVGGLETGGGKIVVSECKNYGKVRGEILKPGTDGQIGEAWFFGGIAGYTGSSDSVGAAETAGLIEVEDCQSSPYYTEDEINVLLEKIKQTDSTELIENYVGGIVGYNDIARIINCNTEQEQAGRRGYVVGNDYVGGIVGYNSSLVSLSGGSNNRNQVHVIGHSFVGGIAGCNAVGTLTGDVDNGFRLELSGHTASGAADERAEIKGWINEGLITSTGDYAGGITGYNSATGVIEDSYSNVEYDGNAEILAQISSQARFAGGVAGYNKGRIESTTGTTTTVSVVSGKDYVGGVAGCNDVGGTIVRYELEGGYIGGSHFVGGFIGLNMEAGIFSHHIKSNPNKVSGDYFVGGVIGGNLVPVSEGTSTLQVSFETDNFLGDLLAEQGAFAGGFIGYNYLLKPAAADLELTDENNVAISHILAAADRLCTNEMLVALNTPEGHVSNGQELEALLENLLRSEYNYANESTRMVITGQGDAASQQTLGSVRGKVFVGGVVGYNQPSTWLEIRNVENITPVEATGYIERIEEGMTETHRYSYAGGMIGKVGERVTLDHCSNRDSGEVRARGTYTGGLAEINYGTIKNCTAGNIGDGTASYVGGIVGVNADNTRDTKNASSDSEKIGKGKGLLIDCSVGGQVSGIDYVGGLAAENYGVISYTEGSSAGDFGADATVDASGNYAGGLVGYAYDGGQIIIDGNVTLNIDVTGTARYAGGIAGVNEGIIKAADETKSYTIQNTKKNSIIGRNYVGGFIGMQLKPQSGNTVTLKGFHNYADVQSIYGYAGGIVALVQNNSGLNDKGEGSRTDSVVLDRCKNYGSVEVLSAEETDDEDSGSENIPDTDDGGIAAAGGITAINHGVIKLCGNYGAVTSNSGYMGGITAINYHKIEYSETAVSDTVANPDKTVDGLELTGDLRVGGIAAINKANALIKRASVRSVILRNQSSSESGSMGGITALNEGDIEDCTVGVGIDLNILETDKYDAYIDLREEAAGYVASSIASDSFLEESGSKLWGNSVALVSYAAKVDMGGIAGQNENAIIGNVRTYGGDKNYSVVAADLRFAGDSMNYFGNIGGIAGINGGTIKKYEFSGYVQGTAGDPASTPEYSAAYDLERNKSRIYGYGGIAGRNGSDLTGSNTANIENCYIGMAKIQGTGDGSNRTNVGGIAGFNGAGASIKDITFSQMTGQNALKVKELFSQTVDTRYAKLDKTTNVRNTWDPPLSVSTSGTVWVNVTNYGHLGGVAGYNRGHISGINWTSDYISNREIEGNTSKGYFPSGKYTDNQISIVDSTGVLVTSGAGLVGGITGYNHRTGSVSQAVTGRYWLVSATSQQLGNGIGGIIGYNISEQDIVSCDNHATVYKTSDDAVGGITGCQENGTSSSWRYYDCKNYGVLYAKNRGGGIVGIWKYKGGTLENCQNYGKVHSLSSCGGGIVALVEAVAGGETISLTRCENFGEIYTNNNEVSLAGILSYVDDSQANIDIQISECVNTGNMIGNYGVGQKLNGRGGILGIVDGKSNVNIRYCRNYGFIREDSRFYGITQGTDNVFLEYCFGAANGSQAIGTGNSGTWGLQYPLSEKANKISNSYYFVIPDEAVKGGQGTQIKVSNKKAVTCDTNQEIVPKIGDYGTYDIVFLKNDQRARRNSDESYRLCKGISGKIGLDFYLKEVGNNSSKLSTPILNNPVLAANGEYTISWNTISAARYYIVICDYRDAEGTSLGIKSSTAYTNSALISSSFEVDGKYASSVLVQVQACSESAVSGLSAAKKITFGTRLPYPQITWELAELSDRGYRLVLNNREEYETFVKQNILKNVSESDSDYQSKLQAEMKKIAIHTTGIKAAFSAEDGGYKNNGKYVLLASPTKGGLENKTVTSYAVYTGNTERIGQSVQAIRESQFPGRTDYQKTGNPVKPSDRFAKAQIERTTKSTDIGFAGKTAEELSYYMKLLNNEADTAWAVYYRSEMMADDPELGVPVAVSVAEQTPIPSTKGEQIHVELGNFPEDFLDKNKEGMKYLYQNVWVRTYPTSMANSIVQQGWKVSEQEYTAEELEDVKVSDAGELDNGSLLISDPSIGAKRVKAGYVIVWAGKNGKGENLYSIYYNSLLKGAFDANDPEKDDQYWYDGTTFMKYQIFYHTIDLAKAINNVQLVPVVYVNAVYDEKQKQWRHGDKYDEADQFVLTWDQAASGGRPAYSSGVTEDHYQNAVYRLTMTGTTADGKATILENEKEIQTDDRKGTNYNIYTADSRNWDYTNIHVKLTRVGEVNTSGITVKFPSAVELDFPMRRRLSQVKDVTISLKRNDQGIVIKDALLYDISFSGIASEEEGKALSSYRITISSLEADKKAESFDVTPDQIKTGDNGRKITDLDLSSFRNERVSITVQAIAKENEATYRNGLSSPAREMTVPDRLLPPQMGTPEGASEANMTAVGYTANQIMTVEGFTTAALTLKMKKDGQSSETTQVNYQIAMELYETETDAREGTNPIEASDANLPKRSDGEKVTMTYSTASGEYTYVIENLPITYAGKWVRVVLRSLGSSSISSVWTDEKDAGYPGIDSEIPEVEPCMVYKLPSVQVDSVKFRELEDTEAWEADVYQVYEGDTEVKDEITGVPVQVEAEQRWVWFDTVEYADDYQIMMIQTPQQADQKAALNSEASSWQVSDVNWMTLKRESEKTFTLLYQTTEDADAGMVKPDSLEITVNGGDVTIPYQENIRILEDRAYYIQSETKIRLESGVDGEIVSVGILLPDCRVEDDTQTNLYQRTEQILVQSLARVQKGSEEGAYRDSRWALVNWSGDDLVQSTDPIDQTEEATAPTKVDANEATVETSIHDVVYKLGLDGATRYLIRITDASGNALGIFGVPVYTGNTTIGSTIQAVWFPTGFKKYADKTVKLEFQSIFDVSKDKGGISRKFTEPYEIYLPKLETQTNEPVIISQMAEPTQYVINITEDAGIWKWKRRSTSRTCTLTASQKTLVWDYELSDATVAGYELAIGGSQMNEEFKEHLDLNRELFGVIPGVREHLEPGGKLLYTVDYHVDGEMVLYLNQEYPTASESNAESGTDNTATASNMSAATASNSDMATASNSSGKPNVLTLECRLSAAYIQTEAGETALRFTLMLPDLSFDWMQEDVVGLYQEAFDEGLYQTETFRLESVMTDKCYDQTEVLLDLIEMRGDLQE